MTWQQMRRWYMVCACLAVAMTLGYVAGLLFFGAPAWAFIGPAAWMVMVVGCAWWLARLK